MKIEKYIDKLSAEEVKENVVLQIEKELNIKIERTSIKNLEKIEQLIKEQLEKIYNTDSTQFINLLYLIDIKEKDVDLGAKNYLENLSKLIFKRILQKVVFKLYYKHYGVFPK